MSALQWVAAGIGLQFLVLFGFLCARLAKLENKLDAIVLKLGIETDPLTKKQVRENP